SPWSTPTRHHLLCLFPLTSPAAVSPSGLRYNAVPLRLSASDASARCPQPVELAEPVPGERKPRNVGFFDVRTRHSWHGPFHAGRPSSSLEYMARCATIGNLSPTATAR